MLSNRRNGTLYIGVTSNLAARVWQHKSGCVDGFTKKHKLDNLIWFEAHENMMDAINREKQLKGGSRAKKISLIESMNPYWRDLYSELF